MELVFAPQVTLVAASEFWAPNYVEDRTAGACSDGERLIEFAGRRCYNSFHNPSGKSNAEYIANMIDHGHLSVLEHAQASFDFRGVSRSFTHELVRHRHFSFSQRSQRYVDESEARFVVPAAIAEHPEALEEFKAGCRAAHLVYVRLVERLLTHLVHIQDPVLQRKSAREAARAVLPNATETQITVTGNLRAWRWFLKMRATKHAEREIRAVAVEVCRQLKEQFPAVFADFEIQTEPETGTLVAVSPYPY